MVGLTYLGRRGDESRVECNMLVADGPEMLCVKDSYPTRDIVQMDADRIRTNSSSYDCDRVVPQEDGFACHGPHGVEEIPTEEIISIR